MSSKRKIDQISTSPEKSTSVDTIETGPKIHEQSSAEEPTLKKPKLSEATTLDITRIISESCEALLASEPDNDKHYFFNNLCRSLTKSQIIKDVNRYLVNFYPTLQAEKTKHVRLRHIWKDCVSEEGDKKGPPLCILNKKHDKLETLAKKIWRNLIRCQCVVLDTSKNAGDTICPLDLQPFKKAHVLNINGRTYSLKNFQAAVKLTLHKGNDLRLEDITISPLDVDKIKLTKRCDMGKFNEGAPRIVTFPSISEKLYPKFDIFKLSGNEIPEFSTWLDSVEKDHNGIWDVQPLFEKYAKARGITVPSPGSLSWIVENLMVVGAKLFRYHPKMNEGKFIFKNVRFVGCYLDCKCWCGVKFVGCQFFSCTINMAGIDIDRLDMNRCEYISCVFVHKSCPEDMKGDVLLLSRDSIIDAKFAREDDKIEQNLVTFI